METLSNGSLKIEIVNCSVMKIHIPHMAPASPRAQNEDMYKTYEDK